MIKVAVLYGGRSPAYEDSLLTGKFVLSLLRDHIEYEPIDVFISREGDWHYKGLVEEPHQVLSRADVAWNALHGGYGESGGLQALLTGIQMPFVGSSTAPSIFAHNKEFAKKLYRDYSLPILASEVLREDEVSDDQLIEIFRTYLHPVVVKPSTGVCGIGIRLVHTYEELKDAVMRTFKHSTRVLVEEYVRGTAASAHVVEKARGEELYALVPIALETELRRVRPTSVENKQMEDMAKRAHTALGLRHYSASDFMITPSGKIYILETNSSPLFHEGSLLHQSLAATGWKPKDFVEHCLKLAAGK
ncbi:MAG TPA: ATP-grasp domain-containing protein [Candidatus Paceibacterota bacterium]